MLTTTVNVRFPDNRFQNFQSRPYLKTNEVFGRDDKNNRGPIRQLYTLCFNVVNSGLKIFIEF